MTTMKFGEAVKIIKDYAGRNTEGDILWALGEMKAKIAEESADITLVEAIAYGVFVREAEQFFAPAEV